MIEDTVSRAGPRTTDGEEQASEDAARLYALLQQRIQQYEADLSAAPVTCRVEAAEVRRWLDERYRFDEARPASEVFEDVSQALFEWTEHARNPMHFGLFRPNVDLVAVAADALVALYDPNLATWSFSPSANEMERHVLRAIARGFGEGFVAGASHFTSGGQEANHTGVAVALTHRFPGMGADGLRSLTGQPVFYLSHEGHHSLEKVAHSTGLGRNALRQIPAGADLRMDLDALEAQIARDRAAGHLPFLVVGTAGTTNAGVIDPLDRLADVAAANDLWFHVDAAWGGAASVSDRLRPHLAGIERADSITCDAHKWLSVPVGAGMFFCRHAAPVDATFGVHAAYAPPEGEGIVIPFTSSMQWSRRFIGLKLFMTLATHGRAGIARRIDHQAEMGVYLKRRLVEAGWTILNDTPLPVACFTRPEIARDRERTQALVRRITDPGDAWISSTLLSGDVPAVRACVTNFDTGTAELDRLVGLLERARASTT